MTTTKQSDDRSKVLARKSGGFLFSFFRAWLVMLALGAIASQTGWATTVGYWSTWLCIFVVRAAFGGLAVDVSSIFGVRPTTEARKRAMT